MPSTVAGMLQILNVSDNFLLLTAISSMPLSYELKTWLLVRMLPLGTTLLWTCHLNVLHLSLLIHKMEWE